MEEIKYFIQNVGFCIVLLTFWFGNNKHTELCSLLLIGSRNRYNNCRWVFIFHNTYRLYKLFYRHMQRKLLLSSGILSAMYLLSDQKSKCCGIIGILSDKRSNIADSLSLGVELLKNRGYDSAGIVTFSEHDGKVSEQLIKRA